MNKKTGIKIPVLQRRRRDSNPRAPEGKRISSAPRYDRFDTTPCDLLHYTVSKGASQSPVGLSFPIFSGQVTIHGLAD